MARLLLRATLVLLALCTSQIAVQVAAQSAPTAAANQEECSVGVAAGRATVDGRPLLWKNRDSQSIHNTVQYFRDGDRAYVGLCTAGSTRSIWGGANDAGFCIMNSVSRDLTGGSEKGPGNGAFMKLALQRCATVADFEALLQRTDASGRRTRANFGVIDAAGEAACFETGHSSYVRFDAEDSSSGILVRTNFATTADGSGGRERFARATQICAALPADGSLDLTFLLRDFVRDLSPPPSAVVDEPGLQDVRETIHRQTTVAALVFHGVTPADDPARTTMWTILGQPLFSIAVPVWPAAGGVSPHLAGDPRSPICDAALRLRDHFYLPADRDSEQPTADEVAGPVRWLRSAELPKVRAALDRSEAAILAETSRRLTAWFERPRAQPVATAAALAELHERAAERATRAVTAAADRFAGTASPAGARRD